jgi:hypothetical protein
LKLLLLILCLSAQVYADSIAFKKNTLDVNKITLEQFKNDTKNLKELEVKNVWRQDIKTYVGIGLYEILDRVYGTNWRDAKMISFKAQDGYTQTTKISLMLQMSEGKLGLIAISEKDKSGFTSFMKNKASINPGPFYLVWSNFSDLEKASHGDALKWPYQLKEINITY